ncbi:hypothetical protein ACFQ14_00860 [Pseudahrensia aquimaris]|uniref:Uncharacterized protein n=1 Tax=Pseudahrensia aquimaris TaxID=744461 RepID=A0ABW3F9K3_9HYPH
MHWMKVVFLALLMGFSSHAYSRNLPVEIYLVNERDLCSADPFKDCKKLNKKNFESVLEQVLENSQERISLQVLPRKVSTGDPESVRSFFTSVRAYNRRISSKEFEGSNYRAALFVFDLSNYSAGRVAISRKAQIEGGNAPPVVTRNPGRRFVHWYNAHFLDPGNKALFTFEIDGEKFDFRFVR